MGYVEFLRVRNAFVRIATIVLVVALLAIIGFAWSVHSGQQVEVSGSDVTIASSTHHAAHHRTIRSLTDLDVTIPLAALIGLACFAAIIFATIIGGSLNKENDGYGFSFTKPIERERLGLEYVAIDLAAILAFFVFILAVEFVVIACLGGISRIRTGSGAALVAASGLGAAFMWNGLLQALTSWHRSRPGIFIGLSWIYVMVVTPAVTALTVGTPLAALAVILNLLNPLAYWSGGVGSPHGDVTFAGPNQAAQASLLGFSMGTDIALTWSIGIAACIAAVYLWKRVEV